MERITKPDWIIHGVVDNDMIVYHTHGLNEYNSLELELNLPLEQKQAMQIINLIGLEIANGKNFTDGDIDNTIFTCDIYFKEVTGIYGDGEKNLRIILPDENFKYPWDNECLEPFKFQI